MDQVFGEGWKERSQKVKTEPEEVHRVEETDAIKEPGRVWDVWYLGNQNRTGFKKEQVASDIK